MRLGFSVLSSLMVSMCFLQEQRFQPVGWLVYEILPGGDVG